MSHGQYHDVRIRKGESLYVLSKTLFGLDLGHSPFVQIFAITDNCNIDKSGRNLSKGYLSALWKKKKEILF